MEADAKSEGRPRAGDALDLDLSTHEGRELSGNRESQSRAAVGACGRPVSLGKSLEEMQLEVVRNIHASVADCALKDKNFLRHRLSHRHFNHDFAPIGKLDGIANENGENLQQTNGISADVDRHILVNTAGEFQSLMMGAFERQEP